MSFWPFYMIIYVVDAGIASLAGDAVFFVAVIKFHDQK